MSVSRKMAREAARQDKMSKRGTSMFAEVIGNMLPIGKCKCGGALSHFVKSDLKNIFRVYCSNPECPVMDARALPEGTEVFLAPGLSSAVAVVLLAQKTYMKRLFSQDELDSIPMVGAEDGR